MKQQPRLDANLNPASIGPEDGEHLNHQSNAEDAHRSGTEVGEGSDVGNH
ncbi:MAG: hypothetical protein IPM17_15500 [Verrucomicrobia bacterium]|nr:hypothetical protein [Verrucomicrobiota bacterium]